MNDTTHSLTEEQLLLKAINSNPHEDTPRLMYADWLEENEQEERAQYIRESIRLQYPPDNPSFKDLALWQEMRSRCQRTVLSYGKDWLEKSCPLCTKHGIQDNSCKVCCGTNNIYMCRSAIHQIKGVYPRHITYARGFIHSVTCYMEELGSVETVDCPMPKECDGGKKCYGIVDIINETQYQTLYKICQIKICQICNNSGSIKTIIPSLWVRTIIERTPTTMFKIYNKQPMKYHDRFLFHRFTQVPDELGFWHRARDVTQSYLPDDVFNNLPSLTCKKTIDIDRNMIYYTTHEEANTELAIAIGTVLRARYVKCE